MSEGGRFDQAGIDVSLGAEVIDVAQHLMKRYETPELALRVMVSLLGMMHDLSDVEAKLAIEGLVRSELLRMRARRLERL